MTNEVIVIFCYVLLTYGKKPSGGLREHAEGRAQMCVFDRLSAGSREVEKKYVSDYCREIRRLNDLVNFSEMLRALEKVGYGRLLIDDLHRIFRRTPPVFRSSLLSEMRPYASHISSILHRKTLTEFTDAEMAL
ncbi:MAG: hypothetical protein LC676_09145, partial [Loktanella sp.]|nr:hypothetical protein [Loktanella sp.]